MILDWIYTSLLLLLDLLAFFGLGLALWKVGRLKHNGETISGQLLYWLITNIAVGIIALLMTIFTIMPKLR